MGLGTKNFRISDLNFRVFNIRLKYKYLFGYSKPSLFCITYLLHTTVNKYL